MQTLSELSQKKGERLASVVLTAVALAGVGVIVGWHLHIRLLVQIVPGVIPMQYNTGLCFIVMGLSGLLLVRRIHVFLPALGGLTLIMMGGLVIYEYLTGDSLGIDTAFFYPWDQTLLAFPGRMALTSAVSFVSSGIGLTLHAFRRQALAAFALLETLPLSLGLTSTIGYVIGITFVLPFNLGSQMAIHTAIAFTAYGTVMLCYAWTQAPQTDEGQPKWAPYVASLMLPVLFLGIGITGQNWAFSLLVPFLIGLVAAGFFAVAARKLTHARVSQKGLILISVPLVSMLLFVFFVTQISRKSEQAHASYLHSKQVISETETILTNLLDAEAGTRGFVIAGNPAFAEPFQRAKQTLTEATGRLKELVKGDPAQLAKAEELGAKAAERIALLENIERLTRGGARNSAIEDVQSGKGLSLMKEFRQIREEFLKEEQGLDKGRQAAVQNAWQRFNWLIVAGSSMNIFLAVMLAILFSGGISKRMVVLVENARAFAEGKTLANPPLKGRDEISHLDRVFREMADALQEAARKERVIFENALDIICSTDYEGRFLKMSPSSLRIWGYRPEEMIGRHFTEFLVSDEVEKSVEASQGLRSKKTLINFENRYRCKDGSIVHMLWSAWWSDTEQVVFAMARDITERKRSEAALRESEERYRLLFEGNPHPVWVYDLETLAFLAVNQAAIQHYGYAREEFLAMTIKDIRPPEDIPSLLGNLSKANVEVSGARTWRHRKKNGEIIDVEISAHRLIFSERDAEIVLANDVSRRKQMETALQNAHDELEKRVEERTVELGKANADLQREMVERRRTEEALRDSEERTRLVVDTALDAVVTIDSQGKITGWNAQAERVFGWAREEAVGRYLHETIIPPRYREAHRQGMQHLLATGQGPVLNKRIEITALGRHGQEFPVELSIAPLKREDRWHFSAFVRDITERKQAEEEIKKLNQDLEHRVKERTAQLESANKELEAFSYSVSHDLRAPLRAIDGFSRLLLEDYSDKLDADGARLLDVIRSNTRNMGRLIDDLLAFSRLGRQQIERSRIDISELARDVFKQLNFSADEKIRFKVAPMSPVDGDPAMIRQVLFNLLSNAAKYSRTKEQVVIDVNGYSENGDLVYYVKDNGVGFDMRYANKLFGVFQRLHSAEDFEGTGVGLAIVQRIIHRHGGRVWADGKVDEGATFYFALPKGGETDGRVSKHK